MRVTEYAYARCFVMFVKNFYFTHILMPQVENFLG